MVSELEERGRETGRIMTQLEFLERQIVQLSEKIDSGFGGLECRRHTDQINEMFGWYITKKKEGDTVKQTIIKMVISSIFGGFIAVFGFKII